MRKTFVFLIPALALLAAPLQRAEAHCQVPCGIYDDHNRVHEMREDVTTIEKAMKQIRELSGKKDPQSQNQLVRWVVTKEQHAEKIMRTIADYFMAQKIKPAQGNKKAQQAYLQKLERHHRVMVAAMVCKQTTDLKNAKALGKAIDAISGYWPAGK